MKQNKIRTYLLYAIGEIALVMIGILLALQVNNWNEERINKLKEQEILKNLKREITSNLIELNRDNALNEQSLNSLISLLDTDRRMNYAPATIDSLIGLAFNFATFDPRTGVIDDVIASGSIALIRDDSIKYMISQWSGELNDLSEDVIVRRNNWIQNVAPVFNALIPVRNGDNTMVRNDYDRNLVTKPLKVPEENYTKFKNSLLVDGILYDSYLHQSFVFINEQNIRDYLQDFLKVLEKEIDE